MNTLGLALIVKDEEKTLGRLLKSVEGLFDEIVVVDTGSTDKTKDIAKQYGARIYDFTWIDDFAAARNFSFAQIKSDWTMWLDADDEIRPTELVRLKGLKPNLGKADAYLMWYDYCQDEFDVSTCVFQRHRIVRTSMKPRWLYPIHECLDIGKMIDCETNITVTHRRHVDSLSQDKGRNIRILKKALDKNPNDQRIRYYYGKELFWDGKHEELLQVLEEHVKIGDYHEHMVQSYYWMARTYLEGLKQEEKAIDTCMRGIRFDNRWAEYYCMIGSIYMGRQDWMRAIQWYEMAASCPQPKSLGPVMPEKYTWEPRLQLAVGYNAVGNIRKAYTWNEEALSYRPNAEGMILNQRIFRDHLFDRRGARPFRLNLGSGGKLISGWRNCDLYPGPGIEFEFDQSNLPYHDSTIHAIRSEHALEHSASHYVAEAAVKDWARALRYGGRLHLMVPDIDLCAKAFLEAEDRARAPGEKYTLKEWYLYTMYGIQKAQGAEPDEGQHHRTGFTKKSLERLLTSNGFTVESITNYDGFGTPSIEAHAVQTGKQPNVAWMIRTVDENDPSTRIRRLNVSEWLGTNGIRSTIRNGYHHSDEGAVFDSLHDFDIVIFTCFTDFERRVMDKLRLAGVTVLADYNEDLAETSPEIALCLQSATIIVCCSKTLADKAAKYGRVLYIPDAYEKPSRPRKKVYAFDVDDTLEVSNGPVKLADLEHLSSEGHVIGLCGNWPVFRENVKVAPYITFVGPRSEPWTSDKPEFLKHLKKNHRADEYVMVGNIQGVSGASDDKGAAEKAAWRFIKESDFAGGER